MSKKKVTISFTEQEIKQMEMIRHELSKLRAWMTGFNSGRKGAGNTITLGDGIVGENSAWLAQQAFDNIIKKTRHE